MARTTRTRKRKADSGGSTAPWVTATHRAVEAAIAGEDPAATVAHLSAFEQDRALACAFSIVPRIEGLAREIYALPTREQRVRAINRYRDRTTGRLRTHAELAARLIATWSEAEKR